MCGNYILWGRDIDGKNSVIFDEAENRLHAQKAVMALLMGKEETEAKYLK